MARIRALTPEQARATIAHRLTKLDRILQLATKFGVRSRRTFLVWTYWDGGATGQGVEHLVAERELLPTPEVLSLDQVSFSVYHAGNVPVGSVKLQGISGRAYTFDTLTGRRVPDSRGDAREFTSAQYFPRLLAALQPPPGADAATLRASDRLPAPFEFFFEMREDGRGDPVPQRWAFRALNFPVRREDQIDWTIMLEKVSGDRDRLGRLVLGPAAGM